MATALHVKELPISLKMNYDKIITTGSAGGLFCPCKGLLLAAAVAALKRFANRIVFSSLR